MKVFVYEFIMGGGLMIDPSLCDAARSLAIEGFSMLRSVAEDFAVIGCEVMVLRDAKAWKLIDAKIDSPVEIANVTNATDAELLISEQSRTADWTLVIAPEIDGHLLRIARQIEESGTKMLSPSPAFIEVAADKLLTFETLVRHGCPIIKSYAFDPESARELLRTESLIVIKPRYGAGSCDLRVIADLNQLRDVEPLVDNHFLMQPFAKGTAVSVSAICCGQTIRLLAPCCQHFSEKSESPFDYQGGSLPVANELRERAGQLALRALESLPPTIGMCGVDLILGTDMGGSDDFVVEINPRLTTSYLGLRKATNDNLAGAMLAAARGVCADLSFSEDHVTFSCTGVTSADSNSSLQQPATTSGTNP